MTTGLNVGLVFGGRSVEHAVSVQSARTIAAALDAAGHMVIPLGVTEDGCWRPPSEAVKALTGEVDRLPATGGSPLASLGHLLVSGADVLFPIIHGSWGEDGCLQGLAEMADLPYVGCDVAASAVTMDKALCKMRLEAEGIPVVEGTSFRRGVFEADPAGCLAKTEAFPLPLFVKPSLGGSSVGVRKVGSREELEDAVRFAFEFGDSVLVERGIQGRELECAILGNEEPEASLVGEIVSGREFYDYADKYLEDGAQLIAPADLPEGVAERLQALAVRAFQAVGGSGLARVDCFLEGDAIYVNEINTLPGFTAISMYPRLWELSGVPRPRLVDRLVELALERHASRRRLDQGIKSWLAQL